jgi:glucose-1-phosphatase
MLELIPEIPNAPFIRNIIFDFGGVICNLDIPRTEAKFREFGESNPLNAASGDIPEKQFKILVEKLETDVLSPKQFRDIVKSHYTVPPTDDAITDAWNALLLPIPESRIHLLEKVRRRFRIFLLSNSNRIHHEKYLADFRQQSGYRAFDELFEKVYFSFDMGMKKPDSEIYEFVLSQNNLNPFETLFIDDTIENVKGAECLGINGYLIENGTEITDLFRIAD